MPYKVINGFNYPDGKGGEVRVNAGTILTELPAEHAQAIIDLGCVEDTETEAVADELFSKADTQPLEEDA